MPSADNIKQIFSFASLVILFLSLGAAGTSLGLLQANTNNGAYATCHFFITYTQAMNFSMLNYNVPTCKLSIASAAIATICLAMLTAIELISVLFQINVKRLIAKIIQVVIFVGSILFLLITMIVVSTGWEKTCATYKNITRTGGVPRSFFNIDCNGPQYRSVSGSSIGPFPPNGAEIITAAVFAGLGVLLAAGALCVYIAQQLMHIRSNDEGSYSRELDTHVENNDNDD